MPLNLDSLVDVITLAAAFLGAFLAALWLSLIIWTYRDMRARSRDGFAAMLAAAVVGVLTLPGLIIYLILRPPRTLDEAYEQSLEEEALLQEIEEKRVCPGCGRQVDEAWIICPSCLTKLKKPCNYCGKLMDLPWNVCPYCAKPVEGKPVPEEVSASG
ncbi:MAG: zinc ribbon domain-containing protein [Anaerolineales bacterium]|nr:zinc ribbon domain-containing protein [Anaerolineales bacterium]